MFEYNGLYLKDVSFGIGSICFTFADTYSKSRYEKLQMLKHGYDNLSPVSAEFRFKWTSGNGSNIAEMSIEKNVDYQNPGRIVFNKFKHYSFTLLTTTFKCRQMKFHIV
jgi:hypothetical protein